jgi:alpha-beta hydrolase superfamily lysophospholipase
MKKESLKSEYGYDIPCCNQMNGEEKTLIICHGFGSSKESPMIKALQETMPRQGIGTFSFDFPSHGESQVDGSYLRIHYCLEDVKAVEDHVLQLSPNSKIYYFGSSFGAYILLLYLANYAHNGDKAFLRSAAVNMSHIVNSWLNEYHLPLQTPRGGDPMQDYYKLDDFYQRDFFITRAFLTDLEQNNVFQLYPQNTGSLYMIHGSQDKTACASDAERFAMLSGAAFQLVPGGEHRLMGQGEMETVLDSVCNFFLTAGIY